MGTVGIVGPTRMHYARAIALVDYLARGAESATFFLRELTCRGAGITLYGCGGQATVGEERTTRARSSLKPRVCVEKNVRIQA